MDVGAIVVLVVLLVGFGVVASIIGAKRAAERRRLIGGWAAARGWTYAEEDESMVRRFDSPIFDRGHRRRALNVVQGQWHGRPVVAMDYRYTTTSSNGKTSSSTVHRFSVVAMNLGAAMPGLSVAPQGAFGRFFSGLFGTDILIGDQPFDDAFAINAASDDFARTVLTPAMRAVIQRHPERSWAFDRDSLIVWDGGEHTPELVDHVLAGMVDVVEQIPEPVRTQYGISAPTP